jgi:hypothetical protein
MGLIGKKKKKYPQNNNDNPKKVLSPGQRSQTSVGSSPQGPAAPIDGGDPTIRELGWSSTAGM